MMKILVQKLQPSGAFYVPELGVEVSGAVIHRALPSLCIQEQREVQAYLRGGNLPSQGTLAALKEVLRLQVGRRRG
jgi:hypothetical protein